MQSQAMQSVGYVLCRRVCYSPEISQQQEFLEAGIVFPRRAEVDLM